MEHRLEQPKFRAQAGLIRKAAEYLNGLLTEILDLAKLDAGAVELAPEPLDLRALVTETADFFAGGGGGEGIDAVRRASRRMFRARSSATDCASSRS